MSTTFNPVEVMDMYCRFCEKVTPCQLERSIAGNGRNIDKNATFEYYCTKCFKTACFSGNDLMEQQKTGGKEAPREYTPQEHYCIGEKIFHKKFKEAGVIVSKDSGSPSRILVLFEKNGLKKLVQAV